MNNKARELIIEFEVRGGKPDLEAYPDPKTKAEPYTIGYGFTYYPNAEGGFGSRVKRGDRITLEQANRYFDLLLNDFERTLAKRIPNWNKLNSNQQAALISFGWNLGAHFYGSVGFQSITNLVKDIASGRRKNVHPKEVERIFCLYVNPGTRVTEGLTRRRKAEARLFSQPVSQPLSQPEFKLVNAMVHYKKLTHQIHALKLLDTILANQPFMKRATGIWRQDNSKVEPIVSLYSCAESWKDLPHQRDAIVLIDKEIEINKIDLTKVIELWRAEPPKVLVQLDVPYIYQLNLLRDPTRMCNVASVAMVLAYREKMLGKSLTPSQLMDLPEVLDIELANAGRSRYVHANLDWLFEKRGVTNAFTVEASAEDIKAHLTKGFPVIYSGRFTRSGHIVVITGFNDTTKTWIVNDPNGRFQSFGRFVKNAKAGIQVQYSYDTLESLNDQPGKYWAHFPSWKI